jgi:hypothetical protein
MYPEPPDTVFWKKPLCCTCTVMDDHEGTKDPCAQDHQIQCFGKNTYVVLVQSWMTTKERQHKETYAYISDMCLDI